MSAWSKAHHIKNDEILFVSDEDAKFSKTIGWTSGHRLARYAIVLDKGKVVYAGKDEKGQLSVGNFLLWLFLGAVGWKVCADIKIAGVYRGNRACEVVSGEGRKMSQRRGRPVKIGRFCLSVMGRIDVSVFPRVFVTPAENDSVVPCALPVRTLRPS
jgi:hypothetical protein